MTTMMTTMMAITGSPRRPSYINMELADSARTVYSVPYLQLALLLGVTNKHSSTYVRIPVDSRVTQGRDHGVFGTDTPSRAFEPTKLQASMSRFYPIDGSSLNVAVDKFAKRG